MVKRRAKGIGLLSGGLDSILAVKVLQEQDLELIGLIFATPFFGPRSGSAAGSVAGIPVRVIDIGERHLEMLKAPHYGYGSQMNPCIDCHGLMLREAGAVMEQEGADFLFTGEVLGQRPMSQRRDALRSVEKLSGYQGRVLRPLSAKLLEPTIVELEGLVDRERLLDIHGRGRKRQVALAAHYGITEYAQPGGGCMLTKQGFARKLKDLLTRFPEVTVREVELLKWGRYFVLPAAGWCIIGRHQRDNRVLEAHATDRDLLLRVRGHSGPWALLPGCQPGREALEVAGMIVASYSDAPAGESVRIEWRRGDQSGSLMVPKVDRSELVKYLV